VSQHIPPWFLPSYLQGILLSENMHEIFSCQPMSPTSLQCNNLISSLGSVVKIITFFLLNLLLTGLAFLGLELVGMTIFLAVEDLDPGGVNHNLFFLTACHEANLSFSTDTDMSPSYHGVIGDSISLCQLLEMTKAPSFIMAWMEIMHRPYNDHLLEKQESTLISYYNS
jgi:hypothetical protein